MKRVLKLTLTFSHGEYHCEYLPTFAPLHSNNALEELQDSLDRNHIAHTNSYHQDQLLTKQSHSTNELEAYRFRHKLNADSCNFTKATETIQSFHYLSF